MPAPQGGLASDMIIGTAFFNYRQSGWSEKYILSGLIAVPATPLLTYTNAATNFKALCLARLDLCGSGVSLVGARISAALAKRDGFPAIGISYSPTAIAPEAAGVPEKINDPEVCLNWRFDDGQGKFLVRSLRGLRDSWVTDFELQTNFAGTNPDVDLPLVPAVAGVLPSPLDAMNNYLVLCKRYTLGVRKSGVVGQPWSLYPLTSNTFRGVRDRQTGRPFGLSRGRARSRV